MMNTGLQRRSVMKGAGALVVSVLLPGVTTVRASVATKTSRLQLDPSALSSYISITEDGSAVGWVGKVDMSQGTEIGWIKIIADELDMPTERVSMVQGQTAETVDQGGASGSSGVWAAGAQLRNAAAEARFTLLTMASEKLGVPVERLTVTDGIVIDQADRARRVSYGDLIGGKHFDVQLDWNKRIGNFLEVKGKAKPKDSSQYRTVGKPGTPRRDVAPKVLGKSDYVADLRIPGMLHGRMIRPPIAGAVPVAVDESSIRDIPGVQVYRQKDYIGLVAPREWDAIRAAKALKVTWSDAKPAFPDQNDIYDHIRKAPVTKRMQEADVGDVDAAFAGAARIVEATYEWPFHSHASMAPACSVADVREGSATVWTASQKPHHCREGVALLLEVPLEKVKVVWMHGPGSYGRNDAGDAGMDAAVLSRAFGKPVRVQGMRHEATQWDPKAPASVHTSRAAINAAGEVIAWHFESKAFSRHEFFRDEGTPEHTLAGQLLGYPLKPVWQFGGPNESYSFKSRRKASETIPPLLARASPLRTSQMRDPGGIQIHFAVESFIDELALATNADPVEFRLRYLSDPGDREVIKAVADRAGWQRHVGPRKTTHGKVMRGQGIAYGVRNEARGAVIAEVDVDRETGKVWARRFVVAYDCGQVVAPDLVRQAIEAQVVQTTSRSLHEEVKFDNRNVTSVDWNTYPILDIKDAPESIDIVLLDHPERPPLSVAEGVVRPLAGAIANAIFDATGVRMRQAPFTPERLKGRIA